MIGKIFLSVPLIRGLCKSGLEPLMVKPTETVRFFQSDRPKRENEDCKIISGKVNRIDIRF
ncbi:MAG: hypothetical protein A2156_08060 [Deltaproteobacteria bacterium RBG_16_48_10]|nr:MAG: hypothetical protein A2156_08060 [Deltaproteobacteria bacterium RBG_16_48_10]